jgi:hypothetical protein
LSIDAENHRAKAARAKRAPRSPAAGATPPASRRRPDQPFVPFVGFESLVVRCGHTEEFGLLPEGKDRFREDRRQKAIGRDCRACREKKRLEQEEASQRRRAEKERRRIQQAAQVKSPGPEGGRLPDGSRFDVSYDAEKQRWSGTLTVPSPDGEPATYCGSGSALFPLLTGLDAQYRASLR